MKSGFLVALFVLGTLCTQAFGDERKAAAHRLADWKFGKTLFGAPVSSSSLRGKVVVVEYWGVSCPTCVKNLGRLAELDAEFRDQGVRVIGAEAHRSGKEQIGGVIKSQGVKFSITDTVKGPISVSGLPYALVFGPEGDLLFSGHPNDEKFEATIKQAANKPREMIEVAAEAEPGLLFEKRTWTNKEGKPLVASVTKVEGDRVLFRLEDGSEVSYEIKKLSEKDQKTILEKAPSP